MADTTNHDFSHLQDVMGTLPMVKRYIVFCLAFTLEESISISAVEHALKDTLKRLTVAFPWLAAQVVFEGQEQGKSVIPKVIPLGDTIELIVKDLRQDASFPTMAELGKANFPFTMLDSAVIAPPIASSWATDGPDKTAPVLILQANFVQGGLLLLFSGNHTQMDMTGLGGIISLFSKACRKEPFTGSEVAQGNQSRRNAVPLLGDNYQPGPELDDVFAKPRPPIDISSAPRWVYFNFPAANLGRLKTEASDQTIVPYISTDDAVCALVWQRITQARKSRLGSQTTTLFGRPFTVRKYFGLEGYLGHMVDVAYGSETDVWEKPLGEVAGRLRAVLQRDEQIKHHSRAFATMIHRLDDKSQLVNGACLDFNRDICISSYANVKCCEWDFGPILGRPEAGRRPKMGASLGWAYMMPKSRNGDLAVGICISEGDVESLRVDGVFGNYAEFVG
ncbi:trichothecene 3-O-acetyltransferase [Pseudomassariella vexata]|uniref:Trichothecene 3-O-acetyltransferase n=1 Tax=Pseudomassariella vexata TaxID=1141098 RepID=A0A1Y2E9X1_9PEZI|nr:trichothecene 3-O-acetyltransferase [Pseudomassariella vexata]ORY68371.1 trichothecene 3-O-acetyltransferase [Pseudomassariella vexata]